MQFDRQIVYKRVDQACTLSALGSLKARHRMALVYEWQWYL